MTQSRRNFLRAIGSLGAVAAASATAPVAAEAAVPGPRWGMVVDLRKCIGCQACTVGCVMENRVPEDSFRTVVSTYEVHENGVSDTYMLPRLCNHCAEPPCVPVCPVGATFPMEGGAVVVDNSRCVGCGYCVQACPYDARFINPRTQTADKCTFCMHRVEAGLLPACVETCVGGARIFGDLNDPASVVSRAMASAPAPVQVLRPEVGTRPQVFYIALDPRFEGRVDGQSTLWRPKHGGHV
jgi:tetrathionate reductase subunit B